MKTLKSLITTCVTIFALSSVTFALPPGKTGEQLPTLKKESQFKELKAGDKVMVVCKICDTVRVFDIKDPKEAMALCKEGRMVYCPVCKKKYKVTWIPPSKSGGPLVTVVDEKGKPCMFFVKQS